MITKGWLGTEAATRTLDRLTKENVQLDRELDARQAREAMETAFNAYIRKLFPQESSS